MKREEDSMSKEEALNILLANACCTLGDICDKCPWNMTDNCRDTNFTDVLEKAIDTILGGKQL